MYRSSVPIVALLVSLWGTPLVAQTDLQLRYVHSQAILAQSPEASVARDQFQRDMLPYENELRTMEARISQLLAQYGAQQLTLTPEVRNLRQQEIVDLRSSYETRVKEIEVEAAKRQEELMSPIMERINTIIQQLRVEGGYTFIFDASAGALLAADETLDLTAEVVRRLTGQASGPGGGER
jgi:outer membrane protein